MESTLFTTLTPNEEANLSGGTSTADKVKDIKALIISIKTSKASNSVTQTATGGKGGNGGPITIGGGKKGKDSPVVLVDSPVSSNGGNGGDAINSSNNAVGAG